MKKFTIVTKSVFIAFLAMICIGQSAFAGWTKKTDISTFYLGRWGAHTFTVNGKIYVGGGYVDNNTNLNDLVSYDPATDMWDIKNNLPGSVMNRSGAVAFTINGKAYMGLGIENFNNFNATWNFPKDLWEYDDANDTWTKKADFPGTGVGFAGMFVLNNKAYIIGGQSGKFSADGLNQVYEYNPASDKWTKKGDFPRAIIISPIGFSMNGKGYVVGGVESTSGNTNKTYEYDPANDTWTEKAAYPEATISAGVSFVANGVAYCGLGRTAQEEYLSYFWAYNPATDAWAYAEGFEFGANDGRMYAIATELDGKVYVGAGWNYKNAQQTYYKDWYQIDPTVAVSISNIQTNESLKLYPNPATDKVYVDASIKYDSYTIYSITGRRLANGILENNVINTSKLPSGQYILEAGNASYKHKKLITITK